MKHEKERETKLIELLLAMIIFLVAAAIGSCMVDIALKIKNEGQSVHKIILGK